MAISWGVGTRLPGLAAWLSLVLATIAAPEPALSQIRPGDEATAPFFCQNNRFTNGDFFLTSRHPDAVGDQDIDVAIGWLPLWQPKDDGSTSLADLYSQGMAGSGQPPTPANGNYASMWIQNNGSSSLNADYREGMFNRLVKAIPANSGIYSFTFKAAPLSAAQPAALNTPSVVGIYGVYRPPGAAALPNAPDYLNVPANKDLFGTDSGVLLKTVSIPPSATNTWVTYTISFDSAILVTIPEITHVMVTNSGGGDAQARYIAFDDFCMQTAISTCCPPSASFPLATMFSSVQANVADSYHLKFTMTPAFDTQMTNYVALVRSMDPSFLGLAMTIRVFDGGNGATPSVPTGSPTLEPDAGIHWHAGGGNGNPWSSAFFTTASTLPANNWTVVEITVWSLGPGRPWTPDCEIRRFAFRPQILDPF